MSEQSLECVQRLYKSDIRSMINFMQSNQNILDSNFKIIDDNVWETLCSKIKNNTELNKLIEYIQNISINYNVSRICRKYYAFSGLQKHTLYKLFTHFNEFIYLK